jgi:dipeptidyl aminopeptidase/acylaminoacyl peptidase
MRFLVTTFLASLALTAIVPAAEKHPFSIHDMLTMQRLSDHQASPDGKWIVFTLRTTDLEANKGRTDLWIVGADGGALRQLTSHPDADTSPVWDPSGKSILFLSTRSGSPQVWRISLDGGEAVQVTHQPLDIGCFVVSRDGRHIAVSIEVFTDAGTPAETKKRLTSDAEKKTSGKLYDKLFFRHWDTWADGRRSHLFVLPIDDSGKAVDKEAIDVSAGMDADVPTKPFGGSEEITFTPDNKGIIFTARDVGREESWSTDMDLYLATLDGKGPRKCLTEPNQATDTNPVFSPDGKFLAYLAMSRPGYEADKQTIVLREWPDGKDRLLTEKWDRSAGSLAWSKDGKTILTTAANVGQNSLFAISSEMAQATPIVQEGNIRGPVVAGDRIVYSLDSLSAPAELYSSTLDGKDPRQLTKINDARLADAKMGEPEQFSFPGWNGEQVYAYVVKPIDFDASQKYPVAFLIHGGPQGSFGNDFHYRWNPQAYAGAGYAAVMVDFHGSTGYGQAFCDAIRGDWGGKPLEDLKKGLDAALKRYPWMDGDRVAALGASFGGYMINWIAGNWPDRFRCLVSHDGNICEAMAYYDTEELWFPEWDHQGTPWEHPENYGKHDPINFVKNWKTPMLVIHGGQDFRVVETQGMGTFTACQRRGIPSKFLYFPDENHWVLKPANSILWHDTVLAWLDQWTKPISSGATKK